jgi:hypothetical protein
MHVNIVVSGFLSEKSDSDRAWEGLMASDESKAYYNLRWNASSKGDVALTVGKALGKVGLEAGMMWLVAGGIGLLGSVGLSQQMYRDLNDVFSKIKAVAKKTGALLAYALMLG